MRDHFSVITVGDATLDTFLNIHEASLHCDINKKNCQLCFNYAEKIPISESAQSVGGNAANVAAGLAKLGIKTAIATELGDDSNGDTIRETLAKSGVAENFIKKIKKSASRYSVILTYRGERTILAYHPPHTYTKPKLTASCDWLYYTSLGQSFETVQDAILGFCEKNPKTKLACNPGSYQLRDGLDYFKKIIPHIYFLILNREEAERIVGKNKDISALLKKISALGLKIVVITDGANGAYVTNGEKTFFQPALPGKIISKTGAGDAFASGFLGAMIKKQSMETALRWGAVNSASVIGHYGAQKGLLDEKRIRKVFH